MGSNMTRRNACMHKNTKDITYLKERINTTYKSNKQYRKIKPKQTEVY